MHEDAERLTKYIYQRLNLLRFKQIMFLFFFKEKGPMTLSPEMQQAIQNLNSAIDAEVSELAVMIQTLIDKIGSGPANETEVINELNLIKTRIEAISTKMPPIPT